MRMFSTSYLRNCSTDGRIQNINYLFSVGALFDHKNYKNFFDCKKYNESF